MIALFRSIFAPPRHLILLLAAVWIGLTLAERRGEQHDVSKEHLSNLVYFSLVGYILGQVSIKTIFISLLFISAVFLFGFLAHEIVRENETSFDNDVFTYFKSMTTPTVVVVMNFFTFFAKI